ncbi:MAG: tetratricopeptide repeat protein [bacterium]
MYRLIIGSILIIFVLLSQLAFSQQDSNDYFIKANSYLVSGKFEEAANFYKFAIQQKPVFPEAYLGLGMAYKESEKYQEAYEATYKAIKLKPSYYQAYYNLGLILEKQNKIDEAIEAYEKFLKEIKGADRFSDAKQRILRLKKFSR